MMNFFSALFEFWNLELFEQRNLDIFQVISLTESVRENDEFLKMPVQVLKLSIISSYLIEGISLQKMQVFKQAVWALTVCKFLGNFIEGIILRKSWFFQAGWSSFKCEIVRVVSYVEWDREKIEFLGKLFELRNFAIFQVIL